MKQVQIKTAIYVIQQCWVWQADIIGWGPRTIELALPWKEAYLTAKGAQNNLEQAINIWILTLKFLRQKPPKITLNGIKWNLDS